MDRSAPSALTFILPGLRQHLLQILGAATDAVDASRLVSRVLSDEVTATQIRSAAAVDVVAVGKAAAAMLGAIAEAGMPYRDLVGVGAVQPATLPHACEWHTTSHPLPDARSLVAARRVLQVAHAAGQGDLLVLLLSGGASALMALPAEGVSLEEKRKTVDRLLVDGASIEQLNIVRKHLSAIKGGWLAAATRGQLLTLAVSDVVGDDLATIGSGPGVADSTTFGMALAVLDEHGGRMAYPAAVVRRLEGGQRGEVAETPKPDDARLLRSTARVIGNGRSAVAGACHAARSLGYHVHVVEHPIVGAARVAAAEFVHIVAQAGRTLSGPVCVVAAGETTVSVRGAGKGGRNQELALAMVPDMASFGGRPAVAASMGTDGIDGPTDAAGALVDSTTARRAAAAGLDPAVYLSDNNSYVFFDVLGDLLRTGPTGTNVGDLQVAILGD